MSRKTGFLDGALAPLRAARLVARHAGTLVPGCVGPLVVAALVALALVGAGVFLVARVVAPLWAQVGALALFVAVPLGALVLVAVGAMYAWIAGLVAAPFASELVARTERVLGAPSPEAANGVARAVAHAALRALVGAGVAGGIAVLALTPLAPVAAALEVAAGALLVAYDYLDEPLSRRGLGFGGKWAFVARHLGACLGFGAAVSLLALVPLAGVGAPALATVGGALLRHELDAPVR